MMVWADAFKPRAQIQCYLSWEMKLKLQNMSDLHMNFDRKAPVLILVQGLIRTYFSPITLLLTYYSFIMLITQKNQLMFMNCSKVADEKRSRLQEGEKHLQQFGSVKLVESTLISLKNACENPKLINQLCNSWHCLHIRSHYTQLEKLQVLKMTTHIWRNTQTWIMGGKNLNREVPMLLKHWEYEKEWVCTSLINLNLDNCNIFSVKITWETEHMQGNWLARKSTD